MDSSASPAVSALASTAPDGLGFDGVFGAGGFPRWRDNRLARGVSSVDALTVEIRDPRALRPTEREAIVERCSVHNVAIYAFSRPEDDVRGAILALSRQLGLVRIDRTMGTDARGIAEIRANVEGAAGGFIPYSDRPLNWHTDGYYNPPERRIRSFLLHCARPAARGGANVLVDPELAYIHLRDRDPAWTEALAHPEAMTIPAREDAHGIVRPARPGPVFSVDAQCERLHLRYTARSRSIAWRADADTEAAAGAFRALLQSGSEHQVRIRLQAGQGIVCNNVLHCREAFEDEPGQERRVFRARYLDRIGGDPRC